jgi:hypothetical protein
MNGSNSFLIAAYVVFWVGVVGYGLRLHRVFKESRRRLDEASRDGRMT